ncbi:hypothetical protein MTO96_009384 [Rhipicephalus appendiculatus]
MGSKARRGSKNIYYLDSAQVDDGGIICVPVKGSVSGNTAYRATPSQFQGGRLLQPVSGTTLAGGVQRDRFSPVHRLQQVSLEDARYGGAAAKKKPKMMRVVPTGKSIVFEEASPSSQRKSSKSARQKAKVAKRRSWYDTMVAVADTSDPEVAFEPEACPNCIEKLVLRRRSPRPRTGHGRVARLRGQNSQGEEVALTALDAVTPAYAVPWSITILITTLPHVHGVQVVRHDANLLKAQDEQISVEEVVRVAATLPSGLDSERVTNTVRECVRSRSAASQLINYQL